MATINSSYKKLAAGYLFPEIAKRTKQFLENNPDKQILKLGIGDTTEPLPAYIVNEFKKAADKLADTSTYTGYGDSEGTYELRKAISKRYSALNTSIDEDEIFVSDGAKPDSANIQSIFGQNNIIAVQDPAYPVYVDSNVIAGRTGEFSSKKYAGLVYMPCTEKNDFFPELPKEKVDLIYLCSPNNPTGAVASKENLEKFINYAIEKKAVIIFDAAYSDFIKDDSLPKSIFEIESAKKCSIEINSFSKMAGFTGVRLGWSVVPKELVCENSKPTELNSYWKRRQNTMFNGASNISQAGGLAVLTEKGYAECKKIIDYYMENAAIIKKGLQSIGFTVYGGTNAPYIWLKTPSNMTSWSFFDKLLNEANIVGTPGSGFGPQGEGFFRLSAFGHRKNIEKAVNSIKNNLKI